MAEKNFNDLSEEEISDALKPRYSGDPYGGENELSEEDLAKKISIETFEESIWTEINKMKDEGLTEYEFNNMIFKLNENGDIDIYLQGIEGRNFKIEPMKIATAYEFKGIRYLPENIKKYNEMCRAYEIEPKLPVGLPDIETIKERQGDDQKLPEDKQGEKQPEEKDKEEKEEPEEDRQEGDTEDNKEIQASRTLPPNAIKLNKNRMADPRNSVGYELERATGEKGVEFYVAPVSRNNNLEYKLFIEKDGVYREVELPESRGTNPTDRVMRMDHENIHDETAVSILYIGKDRAITVFNGGRYAEVDIANRDREGEFSSINIEKGTEQGKVGYAARDIREAGGDTLDARKTVSEKRRVFYELKELEEREMPNEANPAKDQSGIELTELSEKEFRERVKEGIKRDLISQGKREIDAEHIAERMTKKIVDEDKPYSIAQQEAEMENDDSGRTPWEKRDNRW